MVSVPRSRQCSGPTRRSHGGRRRAGLHHKEIGERDMPQMLEGSPAARRPLGRRGEALRGGRFDLSTGGGTARRNAGGQVPGP
jgi:hypothetical protein